MEMLKPFEAVTGKAEGGSVICCKQGLEGV